MLVDEYKLITNTVSVNDFMLYYKVANSTLPVKPHYNVTFADVTLSLVIIKF